MKILNYLIIGALGGLIIRSLIVTVKDMDVRRKMVMNGIIILFLSVLILASLLSYAPDEELAENFGGIVGAVTAQSMTETFGILSFLLPLIFVIAAVSLFLDKVKYVFYRIGGLFLCLFFLALSIVSINPGLTNEKKGEIGTMIGSFLLSKLSFGGSVTLVSFLGLLILYVYLQPTPRKILSLLYLKLSNLKIYYLSFYRKERKKLYLKSLKERIRRKSKVKK